MVCMCKCARVLQSECGRLKGSHICTVRVGGKLLACAGHMSVVRPMWTHPFALFFYFL